MTLSIQTQNRDYSTKTLSHPQAQGHTKALAAGGNNELAAWVEANGHIYQAIVNGTSDLSQADEALFMEWWSYAQGALNGASSAWGEEYDMDMQPVDPSDGDYGDMGSSDPFGGQPGTLNNVVHNAEDAEFGFLGQNGMVRDVWSNDVIINVSPLSGKIRAELTQDTRFAPAENVMKITVTDPSTGTEEVYFIHDYADAKIKIKSPNQAQLTDETGGLVTWSKFKPKSETDGAPQSSIEPIETLEDGTQVIETRMGQGVELNPTAGEDEKWQIYADYNLNLSRRDTAVVYKNQDGTYTIIVTHPGDPTATTDTYEVSKDSVGNINAVPENVTFIDRSTGGGATGPHGIRPELVGNAQVLDASDGTTPAPESDEENKVPEGWDNLKLNGEGNETISEEQLGDEAEMDGETRVFDGQNFNISPVPSGENKTTDVRASGTVTVTPNNNKEFYVMLYKNGQYQLFVYTDDPKTNSEARLKETITFDGALIDLIDLSAIDGSRMDTQNLTSAQMEKIKKDTSSGTTATWPSRMAVRGDVDGDNEARELRNRIDAAMITNDWTAVTSYLSELAGDDDHGNDGIRTFIESVFKAAGEDMDKFHAIMDLLPVDVRQSMIQVVLANTDELSEDDGGKNVWNSTETAQKIRETIDETA